MPVRPPRARTAPRAQSRRRRATASCGKLYVREATTLAPVRLGELGWGDDIAAHYAPWVGKPHHEPARVAVEFNHLYRVYVDDGEVEAIVSGRLKHRAASRAELPAVGDWVVVRRRAEVDRAAIV